MKRRKKNLRSEVVRASSPGFAVEDVTDLQVHRPVGADEHIARCPLHHHRRHLRSVQTPPPPPHNDSLKPELPGNVNATGGKRKSPARLPQQNPSFLPCSWSSWPAGRPPVNWKKKKQEMVWFLWWMDSVAEGAKVVVSCRVVRGGGLSAFTNPELCCDDAACTFLIVSVRVGFPPPRFVPFGLRASPFLRLLSFSLFLF